MIRVLSMLAGCYWAQGDYDRATTYLERELQLATEIGDRRSMADVVGHIGIVHYRRGDYALALAAAEQLMRLAVELGAPQAFFPTAANTMGEIYAKQGAHTSMLACAALQLQIGIETEARLIVALALNDIAAAYAEQGEYQEAERRYRQSIAIYRLLDLPHMLWQALHQLAELYVRRQQYAAAEAANEEALREASRAGIKKHQIKLRVLAIRLRVALGACDIAAATGELEHLLQTWTEELEQAELHYAIWCLHSGEEAHRAAALALYQRAHARTPDWEYRQRLAKLGVDPIPDAPVLPDLPEIVTRHTEDLATLLLRADHYIARLVIT
jgi:tetratricopeptide (TPR) repeat protein